MADDDQKDPAPEERRRHARVRVNLLGRFMLANRHEYPCQIVNMSPGGISMVSPVTTQLGEHIIAYIDHIGRVEGTVTRIFDGGFAIAIKATDHKREKIAEQLTWISNRQLLGLPEDRRHTRIQPKNPNSSLKLPDGRSYECRVIDMSISGAAVKISVCPAIGTEVILGKMRGRVVRHFDEGIAVEFLDIQEKQALVAHFGNAPELETQPSGTETAPPSASSSHSASDKAKAAGKGAQDTDGTDERPATGGPTRATSGG